jgi:hypothetical protein
MAPLELIGQVSFGSGCIDLMAGLWLQLTKRTDMVTTLKTRIERIEAELAAEQQRSAGHRADYERERAERVHQLVTSQDRIIDELKTSALVGFRPTPRRSSARSRESTTMMSSGSISTSSLRRRPPSESAARGA